MRHRGNWTLLLAAAFVLFFCAPESWAQNSFAASPAGVTLNSLAGQNPAPVAVVLTASGAPTPFQATANTSTGGSWLAVAPATGTAPLPGQVTQTLTLTANTGNLPSGTFYGSVTVIATDASASPLTIPVTLNVNGNFGSFAAVPSTLNFSALINGPQPGPQSVAVSSNGTLPLAFTAIVNSQTPWLSVTPQFSTTPSVLSVSVITTGLAAGSYQGTITVTPATGTPIAVVVNLTVAATPTLTVGPPSSLTFAMQAGALPPPTQYLPVTSNGIPIQFSVSASSSPTSWLQINPQVWTTPANLPVTVNPAGLTAGVYYGTISLQSSQTANTITTVPVTLNITTGPAIVVTPSLLSFAALSNGSAPPQQQVLVTSSGSALPFNVQVNATPTGWLQVAPTNGTTPQSLTISVSPSLLAPGNYTGTITVVPVNQGVGQSITVNLAVGGGNSLTASPPGLIFSYNTSGPAPAVQNFVLGTNGGGPFDYSLSIATSNCGANWLVASPTLGSTPTTVTVSIATANLVNPPSPGVCNGSITAASSTGSVNAVIVPVSLSINGATVISSTPQSLTFTAIPGGSNPPSQTVGLSTSTGQALAFSTQVMIITGNTTWLAVQPPFATAPGNIQVSVTTAGLQPGTYLANLLVYPNGTAAPLTIPVTLSLSASSTAAVSPPNLAFQQAQGGAKPPARSLSITSSPNNSPYAVTINTHDGLGWLSVSPATGTTPAAVIVSADGAGLNQGTYQGTLNVQVPGANNSPVQVPVTFTVGPPATIQVSPASLNFTYQYGNPANPNGQSIAVSSTGGSVNYTVQVVTSGGAWLLAAQLSNSTPGNIGVLVNPSGLALGTYRGSVTVQAASGATATVPVTLTVTPPPGPTPVLIYNGATGLAGSVAPGEILSIRGSLLGPATAASFTVGPDGKVPTQLSGTRVLFDTIPAPILYTSAGQINLVVPYGIGGFGTNVVVEYNGVQSSPMSLPISITSPGIFTIDGSGSGQAAVINSDGTVNSITNPAQKGSIVLIYATGEGATNPPGIDGLVTTNVLRTPAVPLVLFIGGQQAEVLYAGSAPGFVAGALQINARIPPNIASAPKSVMQINQGGAISPGSVYIAVRD